MNPYRAELHVHSVLSPCGAVEMIPPLIVEEALDRQIDLIAITDHNASANCSAVQEAARGTKLIVLPGMELQTEEEIHLLCLFDTLEQIKKWQVDVDSSLPDLQNNPDYFGEQFVVDSTGEFIRHEDRLLLTSSTFTLQQAIARVSELGGMAIPAHIDRKANGLISMLGFVPDNLPVDALEITRRITPTEMRSKYPSTAAYPLIPGGDVHHLDDFYAGTIFWLEEPNLKEIRFALNRQFGRNYQIIGTDN